MDSLYNTYLKMLTTPFDDPSSDLPDISPEDYPALFALADRHCTLPFVLPYFRNTGFYPQILQKSKHMMLNYYQIDQFTRRSFFRNCLVVSKEKCTFAAGLSRMILL